MNALERTEELQRISDGKQYARELEMVLLGMLLSKTGDREKILGAIPQGFFDREVDQLLESVRNTDPKTIVMWLGSRGAKCTNGKSCCDAVIEGIMNRGKLDKMKRAIETIRFTAKKGDVEELSAMFGELAKEFG